MGITLGFKAEGGRTPRRKPLALKRYLSNVCPIQGSPIHDKRHG